VAEARSRVGAPDPAPRAPALRSDRTMWLFMTDSAAELKGYPEEDEENLAYDEEDDEDDDDEDIDDEEFDEEDLDEEEIDDDDLSDDGEEEQDWGGGNGDDDRDW
jgi:hypothetical protein